VPQQIIQILDREGTEVKILEFKKLRPELGKMLKPKSDVRMKRTGNFVLQFEKGAAVIDKNLEIRYQQYREGDTSLVIKFMAEVE
jgi:hypothetical protein